jgi:choline transport protein
VTPGPKWGRVLGFFTGSINFFGWMFDLASIAQIESDVIVQMYAVFHPDLEIKAWHTYITYLLLTWLSVLFCIFFNHLIPKLQDAGLFLIVVGGLVTIIVIAAMPKQHASTATVFRDWENATGWGSGVAFLIGVLNGAFTIGTPDAITHMAEELPNPKTDLPKAVAIQVSPISNSNVFIFADSSCKNRLVLELLVGDVLLLRRQLTNSVISRILLRNRCSLWHHGLQCCSV